MATPAHLANKEITYSSKPLCRLERTAIDGYNLASRKCWSLRHDGLQSTSYKILHWQLRTHRKIQRLDIREF